MSQSSRKPTILVSANLFGETDPRPSEILKETGAEVVFENARVLTEDEIADLIGPADALVAGAEPLTPRVLDLAPHLKLIARVGVGYDAVDVPAARARGIEVTYTPDGPWPAVAELTVAMMIDVLRMVGASDREVRRGNWTRTVGRRLSTVTVGIIGVGRIGKAVIRHIVNGFPGVRVLANDLVPDTAFGEEFGVEWTDKERIYREADIVSLHVPLTPLTRNMITAKELALMNPSSCLLNTARGGMIDEEALATVLSDGRLAAAALDVFEMEPYSGPLTELDNCYLTPHIAGITRDCRIRMETDAATEIARALSGEPPINPVPEEE